ncbi:MAG: alpha/beta fold hydrolase [Pseudohongiellaceae bacterium]|nr:alpha/beta fold hydrolase [Pseudohongiellaceae bacterium]
MIKTPWRLFYLAWGIILLGAFLAHSIQTTNNIAIKDVRFAGANGSILSAYLYIPEGVSAENPAPGILAVHGYINSKEVQAGFAIEFARRGYVVLAMDQAGHGYSEAPAFANGFGGPAGLAYLRTLDIVDKDNIGLEGHSMGGWTILAAAAADPDGYKSMVLEGSSVGGGRSMPGSADWPRNVALVFSKYDEFAPTMWQVPSGSVVGQSENLKALFATSENVVEERLYGNISDGTARVLYSPPVTHPGDHISHVAIGHALDWFAQTLDGGTPLAASDQIWFFKEVGTLIALIGFVMLICGSVQLLLTHNYFASVNGTPATYAYTQRSPKWWLMAAASAVIPVASFYPFMRWGGQLLPPSALLPQSITSQVAFWAILNGIISVGLGVAVKTGVVSFNHRFKQSIVLSLATIAIAYCAVVLADYFFMIDFRFWFVGVKALSLTQFKIMLVYLIPFTVFFLVTLRALHGGLSVEGDTPSRQYLSNSLALMGGFFVFLVAQYANLFLRDALLTPAEALNTIVMIQFVPLLLIVAIISTFTYRRTASYVPGALINALFVSWYIVAGQATQFPVT